jgi:hypothetical protein
MSALQALVQRVLALSQALAVGGVRRGIVVLLLTKRGAGFCFHGGRGVCLSVGEFENARGQNNGWASRVDQAL